MEFCHTWLTHTATGGDDSPTFGSPWLKGAAGGGVITLTGRISNAKLMLDFNQLSPREPDATEAGKELIVTNKFKPVSTGRNRSKNTRSLK